MVVDRDDAATRVTALRGNTASWVTADDHDACETFAKLYPRLLRFAAVTAPTGVDASDLVQEALTKTLARRRGLSDIVNLQAYLYRAITNVSRSSRRMRVGAHQRLDGLDIASEGADDDSRRGAMRMLSQLAPRQRACLYLRFFGSSAPSVGQD